MYRSLEHRADLPGHEFSYFLISIDTQEGATGGLSGGGRSGELGLLSPRAAPGFFSGSRIFGKEVAQRRQLPVPRLVRFGFDPRLPLIFPPLTDSGNLKFVQSNWSRL